MGIVLDSTVGSSPLIIDSSIESDSTSLESPVTGSSLLVMTFDIGAGFVVGKVMTTGGLPELLEAPGVTLDSTIDA